jgi:hypothetical protein
MVAIIELGRTDGSWVLGVEHRIDGWGRVVIKRDRRGMDLASRGGNYFFEYNAI